MHKHHYDIVYPVSSENLNFYVLFKIQLKLHFYKNNMFFACILIPSIIYYFIDNCMEDFSMNHFY